MRLIINLILIVVVGLLGYLLFFGIKEPIAFGDAKKERLSAVTDRLKQVRFAQEFYRDITGQFASDFDSLKHVLRTDSFTLVKIIGNPDDPNSEFTRIETKKSAMDSITYLYNDPDHKIKIVLDSLPFVPYGGGATFSIQADTLTYQKTLVNVTEVGTQWKTFMGIYSDEKYQRYDNLYFPENMVKFGDMSGPNLGGNWE
jgi:type II secretory pathway pseudopilin PulG